MEEKFTIIIPAKKLCLSTVKSIDKINELHPGIRILALLDTDAGP